MRFTTLIACTVALALGAAAPASADDQATCTATYGHATCDKAESIARAQWPGSPCEGREQVIVTDELKVGPGHFGEAEVDGSCVTRIRPGLSPYHLCVGLAHEFAHLSGYHGNDPNDAIHDVDGLMSGRVIDDAYAPCAPMRPVPLAAWSPRRWAESMMPARTKCRLIRPRSRLRLYRCGVHRIVEVRMSPDLSRVEVAVEIR